MPAARHTIFLMLVCLLWHIEPANAQNPVDSVNAPVPYGTYQVSDLDRIDVSNGKLTVEIPLVAYPQRGGQLKLDYIVRYHNTGQSLGAFSTLPWDNGFQLMPVTFSAASIGCENGVCGVQVHSPDGSIHPMDAVGPLTYRAVDGTGFRIDLPQGFSLSRDPSYTLIDANGVRRIHQSGVQDIVEDTNGNELDTLGRVFPSMSGFPVPFPAPFPSPLTGQTADYTGCTGPLPVVAALAWNPPGLAGQNSGAFPIKFCFITISETTCCDPFTGQPFTGVQANQLQSIVLPNGSSWTFQYASDGTGNLTQITLPSGGTISYTWINPNPSGSPMNPFAVATRTINPNDGTPPAVLRYRYTRPQGSSWPVVTAVTDPLGNDTVHTFGGQGVLGQIFYQETQTQYYQGSSSGGVLLKTVRHDYNTALATTPRSFTSGGLSIVPSRVTTIWPNGQQSKVEMDYDNGFTTQESTYDNNGNWTGSCSTCGGGLYGILLATREYNLGNGAAGPLLRTTSTPSIALANQSYFINNLLQLPSSRTISDASGATASFTVYGYDQTALQPSGITVQHDSNPPAGASRGNLTSVTKWLNTTGGTVVIQTTWFDTGQPFQEFDELNHAKTHSYDSYYAGAYLTQTCNALSQCVSATYDFNTGLTTSFTNANATQQASGNSPGDSAHTASYSYDSLLRLTEVLFPPDPGNGSQQPHTRFTYSLPNVFPPTVVQAKSVTGGLDDSVTSTYDGLNRKTRVQHGTPNGLATVDTAYDGLSRVKSVTNAYFSTSDPTYGISTTAYDAFSRPVTIARQDGSVLSTKYDDPNTVTVTDEAGNVRRSITNVLGQLIEVDEPPAGGVQANYHALMQTDGNFVILNAAGASVWATGSGATNAASIFMQDDGNLVTYIFKWQAGVYAAPSPGPFPSSSCSIGTYLVAGQMLPPGKCIVSPHGQYFLLMNTDGNFFIYDWAHGAGTWGPGTQGHPGAYAFFQTDGNLVVYDVNGAVLWSSGTSGTNAERLDLNDDGRIIIWKSAWNSGTSDGQFNGTIYAHPGCDVGIGTGTTGVLGTGSCFVSPNGRFELLMQADGNMVIYDRSVTPSAAIWSSGTVLSPVDPSIALRTLYSYDALGNLTCVEQHGDAASGTGCSAAPSYDASSPWRIRRFTYDSLSRLLTSTNPESGTITYSYDNDGELLHKTSPAPNQTGTATQTVSYCYDPLHRIIGKGYGAQSCPLSAPVVTYAYDSGANAIGHLTSLTDQAGTATYGYDVPGRLSTESRTLTGANNGAISKSLSYEYNLDGSLKVLHYPSGALVTYTPWKNSALAVTGAFSEVFDSTSGTNYVLSGNYGANGEITGYVNGSGGPASITNTFNYNKRLQPVAMSAATASQSVFSIGYDFHAGTGTAGTGSDNGNVYGIYNYRDRSRDQSFTYDALNRLTSAQNTGTDCTIKTLNPSQTEYWGNSYSYDAWGNLLGKNVTKCGAENLSVTADAHNWIHASGTDYQYDAAGNITRNVTPTVQTYNYDEENRLTGAAGYTYTYDADGNRVRKSNGNLAANGTLYWYMTPGVVAESDLAGTLKSEYIFFDGDRVARRDGATGTGGVFYYFSDDLKTASVITDAAGVTKAESDYYPWGGELQFIANDSNDYKFTGKKRYTENGLDYFGARYYSNALGRWTSADWSAKPVPVPYADFGDPQSLNLYTYVRNLPTTRIDETGHDDSILAALRTWWNETMASFSRVKSSKDGSQAISSQPNPVTGVSTEQIVHQANKDFGTETEILYDVASLADLSGLGAVANAGAHNDVPGAFLAMAFIHIPGGGSIGMAEAKNLVGAWGRGSFKTVSASLRYHNEVHGAEVGAKNVWQYMRKAEAFKQNLKGATKHAVENGTRYEKNGKYIILDKDKKILSYGKLAI